MKPLMIYHIIISAHWAHNNYGWYIKSNDDINTIINCVKNVTNYVVNIKQTSKYKHKPVTLDEALQQIASTQFYKSKLEPYWCYHYKLEIPLNGKPYKVWYGKTTSKYYYYLDGQSDYIAATDKKLVAICDGIEYDLYSYSHSEPKCRITKTLLY